MKIVASLLAIAFVSGCAWKSPDLHLNTATSPSANYRVIDKPREAVWDASVVQLGKQGVVINNFDKSSGLINISYSGDPVKFIDCGNITSYVKDAQGERTYDFPGARAQATYEKMNGGVLFHIDRKMSLEARVNLALEEINPNQTKVTAKAFYVVQKDVTARRADSNVSQSWSDSISFKTGGSSPLPNDGNSAAATVCMANGELEQEILSAIK
jgi:hypothetical protein